jgi:hypothetical protein
VHGGPRRPEDTVAVRVAAPGDGDEQNNTRLLHVLFRYCDVTLRSDTSGGMIPNEGPRGFDFTLRNVGTAPCRQVRIAAESGVRNAGSPQPFSLAAGRSVSISDEVRATLARRARPGTKVRFAFRALASGDVNAANDTVRLSGRVVRVGDSSIKRASSRAIRGSARAGWAPAGRKRLPVRSVDVAIRRLGAGCRWLSSPSARFRRARGTCKRPAAWLRADGTTSWRLALRRALPPGRYVAYSRVRNRGGFREGRFSAADRNMVRFTVG